MAKINNKAFTLVELLAVIVILAVILVIAVPQIMNVITESRKGALASAAKLIASSAETAKLSNDTLGITDEIRCQDVSNYNTEDYTCSLKFEDGKAKVTITGHNKFNGMYVCDGTKENAEVVSESCTLVSFSIDLVGGSDTVDYQGKYEAGSKVTLVEPTKEGHTFAGWTVSPENGASINGNELTMGTVPVAITANWTKNTYTITYELDGGTNGTGNPESGEYGAEITLNNPTKTGYTFDEWTVVGGSLNGNKLTIGVSNVVLTATWIVIPAPVSFSTDSWETISEAVKDGNTSKYNVGDTRTINLGTTLGEHTVRIANMSACPTGDNALASQTACGFVIEFADIISNQKMNDINTNSGGWEDSAMRTYVNGTIYDALVSAIGDTNKTMIIDTTVVSGHESGKTTNYTTTDKVYLLSTREVWGKKETFNQIDNDNADGDTITRQLDYYENKNVSTRRYSGAKKQYGGSYKEWLLRSAVSTNTNQFCSVQTNGDWIRCAGSYTRGVSPAFRLG